MRGPMNRLFLSRKNLCMRPRFLTGLLPVLFSIPLFAQQPLTVQEAVATALQKNYDVRLMQNAAATAFSDDSYSVGLFLPTLNADGSYTKSEFDSRETPASGDERVVNGLKSTVTAAAGRLSWTLFDGTKMFATRKRLDLTADQVSIGVKDQMN